MTNFTKAMIVLALALAAGIFMGARSNDANAQAALSGQERAKYTVNNRTVTEFTLTDGTPCVLAHGYTSVDCGWGHKWQDKETK